MSRLPFLRRQKALLRAGALMLTLAAIALPSASAIAAPEAASAWIRNEHAAVRLLSAQDSVDARGRLQLGLEFDLRPGWHIYWRSPGDAGYPPRVDWTQSRNLAGAESLWPLPERYEIFGLTTFVYGGNVILPFDARVSDPERPLALAARVSYLVCEKVCIPYEAELALDIPAHGAMGGAAPAEPSAFAARIGAAAGKVPPRIADAKAAPLGVTSAVLVFGPDGSALEVLARSDAPFTAPELLVEGPSVLRFGIPEVERGRDARNVLIRVPVEVAGGRGAVPDSPSLIVTLADGGRAVEQRVRAGTRAAGSAGGEFRAMLLFALLGGVILNLMPCVLPVLSLKILSVVGLGGAARGEVRRGFLVTSAGILVSFWALAGAAAALQAGGVAVGWGMQFQSPAFLAMLAAVVTLFAANLFGLFHIPLPGFAGRLAGRAPGERDAAGRRSLAGAFATGAFATLLATPCSAPFLGTALGFALTRGTAEIFAVFTMLGVGLAAPYLLVAAFPGLAARLPRPGPWMRWLRIVLGVALLAAALWLLSVLWTVAGPLGAGGAGAALALLLGLLAVRARTSVRPSRHLAAAAALAAAVAVVVPVFAAGGRGGEARPPAAAAIPWRPFDKVALHNLVAEGRVVFVDVTADWCITCKANKALVIERDEVAAALGSGRVVPMLADWTRPDPAISAYLRSFGRYGIPFNAVYGPGAPAGVVLPELLTQASVLAALEQARGTQAAAK